MNSNLIFGCQNDWITKKYRDKGNLREIIADKVMDRFTTSKKHLSVLGRTRTLASKSLFFKEVEGRWPSLPVLKYFLISCDLLF